MEFRDEGGGLLAIQYAPDKISYNEARDPLPIPSNGQGDWFGPQPSPPNTDSDPLLQDLLAHLLRVEGMAPAGSGAWFLDQHHTDATPPPNPSIQHHDRPAPGTTDTTADNGSQQPHASTSAYPPDTLPLPEHDAHSSPLTIGTEAPHLDAGFASAPDIGPPPGM
ncbi:hypothetical protein ACTD5D_21790 [Nocardia takedensis]|uniref:hypothetical protein n=1 Tax=Nocardia takedensis TaxID=259390 RepID=UPI003F76E6FA